jgi:hypothetical protein
MLLRQVSDRLAAPGYTLAIWKTLATAAIGTASDEKIPSADRIREGDMGYVKLMQSEQLRHVTKAVLSTAPALKIRLGKGEPTFS